MGLIPLETGAVTLPMHPIFFGVIALAILLGLLQVVRGIGASRRHSE